MEIEECYDEAGENWCIAGLSEGFYDDHDDHGYDHDDDHGDDDDEQPPPELEDLDEE